MCIDKQSNTLPAITGSGGFTVNFLASGREALARLFASKADDKFRNVLWEPASIAEGGPVLRFDSAAHAVCRLQQKLAAGDHWILVGEVVDGAVYPDRTPLLYGRRTYAAWPHPTGTRSG
jgi:flavin reductase (DIM6/NTAB) family NADH-FMN oxidoreductase RutF